MELKYLEGYFENYIKAGVKDIEESFMRMKKEEKKSDRMIKSAISDDDSYEQS